jgi:acylphosphatase
MNRLANHVAVYFTGRVQGVGFRYSTLQVAKEFEVAGFVRNLDDGRVYMEAEGTRQVLAAFVDSVGERMHGFVKNIEHVYSSRLPQFSGFEIR